LRASPLFNLACTALRNSTLCNQSVQDEQRAFDSAQLAQGHDQAVLARITPSLRSISEAVIDLRGQPQNLVPVSRALGIFSRLAKWIS